MTFKEIDKKYFDQWLAANSDPNLTREQKFFGVSVNTWEAREVMAFDDWQVTRDGRHVAYRDRMYHPKDYRKEIGACLEDVAYIPNDDAKERLYESFKIYRKTHNKDAA